MLLYSVTSATLMTLAIPLQFVDLGIGIIYPFKEALLVTMGAKMLGSSMTYYVANHWLSKETR